MPAYLSYIEERLGAVVNSESELSIEATDYLMSKGNSFTVNVEYTGNVYESLLWDNAIRGFKIHNNWISSASGTDLSFAMVRTAFGSIE
jgi:hypothetical protein